MRLLLLAILIPTLVHSQSVLHYTETSGFDHGTRTVSFNLFQMLGAQDGYAVVDDSDGAEFNSLGNLLSYDVVVFSNTSGDAILDSTQRANFEAYVNAGGHVLGIHAASDTYRHSTANGSATGSWDFYSELIGASVQSNPNHVNGTPSYQMMQIGTHQSTAALPNPWHKNEEYYYWENGYYDSTNTQVLQVEETVQFAGAPVQAHDSARAMSWYRELATGSRVFYTALGHAQSNYSSDSLFIQHIRSAMQWLLQLPTGTHELSKSIGLNVYQSGNAVVVNWEDGKKAAKVYLHTIRGTTVRAHPSGVASDLRFRPLQLPSGVYTVQVVIDEIAHSKRFVWIRNQ